MVDSSSVAGTRYGEVIGTSTSMFTAETDQLHTLPPLGALVRVGQIATNPSYAVVSFGETGGFDSSRVAVRRGNADVSDAAIYARHPELNHVLRTVFQAATIGYRDGLTYRHTLPALPVPLHYSVHPCDATELRGFTAQPRYFSALLQHNGAISGEYVLAAHLRWVDEQLNDDHAWLADATRRVAKLMQRDYERLSIILEAIAPD